MGMKSGPFLILLCLIIVGCEDTSNLKDAIIQNEGGSVRIKLLGRRKLMVHSLGDAIKSRTYIDSLIICTPKLTEGTTNDIEIPVGDGNYRFKGSISKKKRKLTVTIFIEDTARKALIPSDWNGTYYLPD